MGKHSIERGSTDTWTPRPHRYAAVAAQLAGRAAAGSGQAAAGGRRRARRRRRRRRRRSGPRCTSRRSRSARLHHSVEPARLPDRDEVHQRAARDRHHGAARDARRSPCRARRIRPARTSCSTAQAFRPHVIDMFEPQDHPDNFPYPGRAADAAVRQRRLDARVSDGRRVRSHPRRVHRARSSRSPTGTSSRPPAACRRRRRGGYSAQPRSSSTRSSPSTGCSPPARTVYRAARRRVRRDGDAGDARRSSQKLARRARRELRRRRPRAGGRERVEARSAAHRTVGSVRRLDGRRLGALDSRAVRVPVRRASSRRSSTPATSTRSTTCSIFVDGAIPGAGGGARRPRRRRRRPAAEAARRTFPPSTAISSARVTADRTLPQLQQFIENGGTVIAIGTSATNLATFLQAADRESSRRERRSRCRRRSSTCRDRCCARASTRRSPLAAGMNDRHRRLLRQQPGLQARPGRGGARREAASRGSTRKTPLRSGWAWGQAYLESGVIAVEATRRQGPRAAVRPGDPAARAAARHVQVPVQRDLLEVVRPEVPRSRGSESEVDEDAVDRDCVVAVGIGAGVSVAPAGRRSPSTPPSTRRFATRG